MNGDEPQLGGNKSNSQYEAMRLALLFYANPDNWERDSHGCRSVIYPPDYNHVGTVAMWGLNGDIENLKVLLDKGKLTPKSLKESDLCPRCASDNLRKEGELMQSEFPFPVGIYMRCQSCGKDFLFYRDGNLPLSE